MKQNTTYLPGGNTAGAMRIMDALSAVDEELLERCRIDGRRSASGRRADHKPLWQYTRAWAAVLCMAVLGAAAFTGRRLMGGIDAGDAHSGSGMEAAPYQYFEEMEEGAETAMDMEEAVAGAGDALAAGGEDVENGQPETVTADGAHDDAGQDGNAGADATGSSDGMDGAGWEEKASQNEGIMVDSDACKKLEAEEYTLEQARAVDILGSYVPTKLPANYVFEGAYSNLEMDEANLTVSWCRGMDYLMLSIQKADDAPQAVDIEHPEMYDVRLYEIPYGETVPREYRQTFDNPVFSWEDLSQEVVESRMKSYTDAGDTDTPRGRFAVLFPDGVIVRFNGRGTAEQIWEMFCSMEGAE